MSGPDVSGVRETELYSQLAEIGLEKGKTIEQVDNLTLDDLLKQFVDHKYLKKVSVKKDASAVEGTTTESKFSYCIGDRTKAEIPMGTFETPQLIRDFIWQTANGEDAPPPTQVQGAAT